MSARLLKQPGNRATFTIKMPINAASRAAVDAENERVRRSVIPIIRDKNGRPYLEGSAVALTYRGRKCLVTALHVLSRNKVIHCSSLALMVVRAFWWKLRNLRAPRPCGNSPRRGGYRSVVPYPFPQGKAYWVGCRTRRQMVLATAKKTRSSPQNCPQKRRFIKWALVERLLFLVEREHGFLKGKRTIPTQPIRVPD